MGKTCNTILGIGLAGAIVGMHLYLLLDAKSRRNVKRDVQDAVRELKRAAEKIAS